MNKTPSWDDLRMLLAVHRDRSFLAAGKSLGIAPSTVARRIEALERTLGRPLVHRANDGARLDADALRLVALAENVELGLASLERGGRGADVSGTVRVSIPEGFVRFIVPVLARLHAKHAALSVELVAESRLVDLARGEADLALRLVRSTSKAIVSKLLGRAKTGLFASRDYVERRLPNAKLPRSAAPLHDWVGLERSLDRLPHQVWLRAYGASRFALRSGSSAAIEQAVLAGMGIGLLSELEGRTFPGLVELDLDAAPPPVDVFIAFHRDAKKAVRTRTVARELEAETRRQLA